MSIIIFAVSSTLWPSNTVHRHAFALWLDSSSSIFHAATSSAAALGLPSSLAFQQQQLYIDSVVTSNVLFGFVNYVISKCTCMDASVSFFQQPIISGFVGKSHSKHSLRPCVRLGQGYPQFLSSFWTKSKDGNLWRLLIDCHLRMLRMQPSLQALLQHDSHCFQAVKLSGPRRNKFHQLLKGCKVSWSIQWRSSLNTLLQHWKYWLTCYVTTIKASRQYDGLYWQAH